MSGRCPWHGEECTCEAAAWLDPHRGIFAKWMSQDGMAPPHCEERMSIEVVGAYIRPQRVSNTKRDTYLAWLGEGKG